MIEFKESKFYKLLQDFFINNDKETFLQMLAEFYNRTEGIINKNIIQDDVIKELNELYLEFNEKGIDENIVREKVNYFLENSLKIQDIILKLITNTNKIEDNTEKLNANTNSIENINSQLEDILPVIYKEVVPELFGAKGDGVTDDTVALQKAIDFCEGGGKIKLPNNYKITNSIILKRGVTLEGNNDGTFTTLSKILVAINDNRPVIKFDTLTTGIRLEKFSIKPFNSSFAMRFNGIEFNSSEYTHVENVFVEGAKNGYYFTANDKANYLINLIDVSATNCDVGILFKENPTYWSNGVKIKIKELSDNRIGLLAYHGQGNTIIGSSTEVGRNSEIGINIKGGYWDIKGNLWIENSPKGIVVDGGVLSINGELYNIKSIEKNGGHILQNSDLFYTNYVPKKLCYHDLKLWLSFDSQDSNLVNYADGSIVANENYSTTPDGLYGHSSYSKSALFNNNLKGKFNATQDWTLLVLLKSELKPGESVVLFNMGDDTRQYSYYINFQNFEGKTHIRVSSNYPDSLPNGNFNLGNENNATDKYEWFIISYDSINKKINSYNVNGLPVAANPSGNINIQGATQGINTFTNVKEKVLLDEFILFNRKLDQEEIRCITHMDILPPSNLKINVLENKINSLMNN